MKSSKLIQLIQEADPSGEIECCIGNADIHYVDILPAYYDGCLQVLDVDDSGGCCKINGAKRLQHGYKLVIKHLSIGAAIECDPDIVIDYSNLSSTASARYKDADDATRKSVVKLKEDIERDHFVKYIKGFLNDYDSDDDPKIKAFYDKHFSYKDPLPVGSKIDNGGRCIVMDSVYNRRELAWDHQVKINFNDEFDFDLEFVEGVDVSNIQCS